MAVRQKDPAVESAIGPGAGQALIDAVRLAIRAAKIAQVVSSNDALLLLVCNRPNWDHTPMAVAIRPARTELKICIDRLCSDLEGIMRSTPAADLPLLVPLQERSQRMNVFLSHPDPGFDIELDKWISEVIALAEIVENDSSVKCRVGAGSTKAVIGASGEDVLKATRQPFRKKQVGRPAKWDRLRAFDLEQRAANPHMSDEDIVRAYRRANSVWASANPGKPTVKQLLDARRPPK